MGNASEVEVAWLLWAACGWIVSLIVLGGAITLLVNRYQDSRNGAIRLLAWQFAIVSFLCVVGLAAALSVGIIASFLPPRTETLDEEWEIWLATQSIWLTPMLFFILGGGYVGIAASKFFIGMKLRQYYIKEIATHYTANNHPNRRRDDPDQGDSYDTDDVSSPAVVEAGEP